MLRQIGILSVLLVKPIFEVVEESTRSVLLAPRSLTKMDKEDRI
ncbi:MAG: hypothetical protein WA949_09610 [Phormidesmis sp.]